MEFRGKKITSVTTPKATYEADATVVNADFQSNDTARA